MDETTKKKMKTKRRQKSKHSRVRAYPDNRHAFVTARRRAEKVKTVDVGLPHLCQGLERYEAID